MANITVSTTSNFDDSGNLSLGNGETITISSGAVLTVNSDVRWGQNAAVVGVINVNDGELKIDGTNVWWVPFSSSTGNVPSLGTPGTADVTRSGTNVGEFLGIFTALGVAPTASGSAMPSSGFIKLRSKSATFANSDVLTFSGGATATLSGAGQRGWLHFVGVEGTSSTTGICNVPRLGKLTVTGDWFELGTCSGSSGQTFQYYVADYCPAIQIETGSGTGVYEWWGHCPSADFSATVLGTDDRAKFYSSSSAGVITIGGSTYGKLPPSGAKVRVPNIHLSSSTSTDWTANTFNSTTLANRYGFSSTGGDINLQYLALCGSVVAANANLASYKFCTGADGAFNDNLSGASHAGTSEVYIEGCATSRIIAANVPMISINYVGKVTIKDCAAFRTGGGSSNSFLFGAQNCAQVAMSGCSGFSKATVSQVGFSYSNNISVSSCNFALSSAGNGVSFTGCSGVKIATLKISSKFISGDTTPADFFSFINCNDVAVDDISFYAGTDVPSLNFVSCTSQCSNVRIRNIGTRASPIDLGSAGRRIISFTNSSRCFASRIYSANGSQGIDNPILVSNCDEMFISDIGNPTNYADNCVIASNCNTQFIKRSASGGSKAYSSSPADGNTPYAPGTAFGTHFFEQEVSSTEVWLTINCGTEKSTSSFSTNAYTIDTGTPPFDGSNGIQLKTLNDQITWTWTYWIRGLTAFANTAPILSGTNTGNMTFTYDLDKGTGFPGSYKTLNATNLSGETGILATGVKLRVRAKCSTANSSNLLRSISIVGTTSTTDITNNYYPYNEPPVVVTGIVSGSIAAVFKNSDGKKLDVATGTTSITLYPEWFSDVTATLRVRKPGYDPITSEFTLSEAGLSYPVSQVDNAIANTDPGALGITVTNHGASPVTWNSKQWSITVTVTDSSSAASIAQFLSWQTAQDSFSLGGGFHNMAWPAMVIPVGSNYETARGTLFGSAGATLKGVRIIDGSGNEIPGFARMQADDGTYYSPATSYTLTVSNIVTNSRLLLRRTDTQAVIANTAVTTGTYTYSYTYTSDIPVEIVVRKATSSPYYQEWRTTTTLTNSNNNQTANQVLDT